MKDPISDYAAEERVAAPEPVPVRRVPPTRESVFLAAAGVGIGAAFAGIPGALAGGAVGWVLDRYRRKLLYGG